MSTAGALILALLIALVLFIGVCSAGLVAWGRYSDSSESGGGPAQAPTAIATSAPVEVD